MADPNYTFPSRQDDNRMDYNFNNQHQYFGGSFHHPRQGYGDNNQWATYNGGWATHQHAQAQFVAHSRSTSDNTHATSLSLQEQHISYGRRYSVPAIHHGFQPVHQSQPAQRCNVEPQMLQGYPQMGGNQYQQCMGQSIDPDLLAPPLLTPIMIPTTHGGSSPSKNSASPTNTPWYTPQSTPPPPQRLSPGFQSGSPQRLNQAGGRPVNDRAARSNGRVHPYQHRGALQVSPMWEDDPGSDNLSPVASGSQNKFEGSDFAISPGADMDSSRGFPSSPANTNGVMSGESEEAKKARQRLRKRGEREREAIQLGRVKRLFGSEKMTQAETLERIIVWLGGTIPARKNEPTQTLQGRDRSDRAKQVSVPRAYIARLFEEIGRCLSFADHATPRRELLLQKVADEFQRRGN